ncbi:signal transduction histidine kinase [Arthrobacter pigmenti]|uniref:histidine kinase n=1 Tax=Arthrobacter pigmenti TaxID=271432 RepID=A0A846RT94_9MICC|nr:histidine kinase [Arthrobacter pigmenti]NJC23742.1 signal transduction histidine kinase [Arthrobacter pigmenti]
MTDRGRKPRRTARIARHFVFMMIGTLLAVPYFAVFIWAAQLASVSSGSAAVAFALLVALLAVPASLSATRALERTAVRELLAIDLPEPIGLDRPSRRWRGVAWYMVHLLTGSLLLVTLVVTIPLVVTITVSFLAGRMEDVAELAAVVVPFTDTTTAVLWTFGLSVAITVFTVLAGSALPHWAEGMLGPDAAERSALEAEQQRAAARRNELARELHDSVGHALTVTTLQSTAAQRLLATDPDAAARAMHTAAETGRAALAELDRVIGILRSSGSVGAETGLEELPTVVERFTSQGLVVVTDYDDGALAGLPPAASAAALRVLQEGLTNALKYASPREARLQVLRSERSLQLILGNPVGSSSPSSSAGGGRGLDGIRERARLVDGSVRVCAADGQWTLDVSLPLVGSARG